MQRTLSSKLSSKIYLNYLHTGKLEQHLINNTKIISNSKSKTRTYISRAHTEQKKVNLGYSVQEAIDIILQGTQFRREKREKRWEKGKEAREKVRVRGDLKKFGAEETPYRNQDETIELYLNMNLDPRKPGQALRGSISLPHGTGKRIHLAVFSANNDRKEELLSAGATVVGGDELIQDLKEGTAPINFTRVLATQEMLPHMQKELGRILGPRKLMPNVKAGTVIPEEEILPTVEKHLKGSMVGYKTDKNGVIHAPVGKASFGREKLVENLRSFLLGIQDAKPDVEKKKMGKNTKKKAAAGGRYIINVFLGATQGKSVPVHIKSADPTSPFFLSHPDATTL